MKFINSVPNASETYPRFILWAVFFFVASVYAVFLMTGDVQEDALITFRTALNFADYGDLSFNLGEHYSGATSYLYPIWIALIRKAAGEFVIPAVLVINSLVVLGAAYLFANLVSQVLGAYDNKKAMLRAWVAIALTPIAVLVSIRGMEAVYVILFFIIGLYLIRRHPQHYLSYLPILVLPLVRPDAIAFSCILAGFAFFHSRQIGIRYVFAAVFGLLLLFALNYLIFGSVIPTTAQAKAVGVIDSRSLGEIASGIVRLYFSSALFSPFSSKYLIPLYPFFSVLAIVFSVSLFVWAWRTGSKCFPVIAAILAGIWLVPGAFSLGGVVFPWYLWPSKFLYQAVFVSVLVAIIWNQKSKLMAIARGAFVVLIATILMYQLLLSYNKGRQEMGFRASVGKYIASIAKPGDSLFLEPAGYIPYYARLKTIDEVGLTSAAVLKFKRSHPENWWIQAVKSNRPTFLVQRDHILENKTYQGATLESADADWLWENYGIVKTFTYNPNDWAASEWLRWVLRRGSHASYHLLQLREAQNVNEGE